jgi:uncharacterized protein (TIGR02145 family)
MYSKNCLLKNRQIYSANQNCLLISKVRYNENIKMNYGEIQNLVSTIKTLKRTELRLGVIDETLQQTKLIGFPVYSVVKIINSQMNNLVRPDGSISSEGWYESEFEINSSLAIEEFVFLPAFKGKFARSEREQLYTACRKSGITPEEIDKIIQKIINFKEVVASEIKEIISKSVKSGTAFDFEAFTDSRDARVYKIIKIGTQVWLAENLAWLPSVNPSTTGSQRIPCYYVYGYEGNNVDEAKSKNNYKTYGVLYNWAAAKIACPPGWHLPFSFEWERLIAFLGSHSVAGGKMKALEEWANVNIGASNVSGFSALPGGNKENLGSFQNLNVRGNFWSASDTEDDQANFYLLKHYNASISKGILGKYCGLSVRCIRN